MLKNLFTWCTKGVVVHRCYRFWQKWPIFTVVCNGVVTTIILGRAFSLRRRRKSSSLIWNFVGGKYNIFVRLYFH